MFDVYAAAVTRVLKGMQGFAPEPLLDEVNHRLRRDELVLDEPGLVDVLLGGDPNDPVRVAFHIQLARWEALERGADPAGRPAWFMPVFGASYW